MGLVRGIVDFGVFVQLYVAFVDKDEKKRENAKGRGGERESRTERRQRRGRKDPGLMGKECDSGRNERRTCDFRNGRRPFLEAIDTAAAETTTADTGYTPREKKEVTPTSTNSAAVDSGRLLWLFTKSNEEGGRRAFDRHTVCGGADHAMITLESAAAIVRDAGKVLPVELAWRWGHESSSNNRLKIGHLSFPTFVEMCEELKDHMTNVSIISDEEDCCSPANSAEPVATDSSNANAVSVTK